MPKEEFNAAVTGVAQYFQLRKEGKVAEAERQRQRTMTQIDAATRIMGMGVQREELRLSRLAGQRAEQLLPGQRELQKQEIAAGKVDIATGEQALLERKATFEATEEQRGWQTEARQQFEQIRGVSPELLELAAGAVKNEADIVRISAILEAQGYKKEAEAGAAQADATIATGNLAIAQAEGRQVYVKEMVKFERDIKDAEVKKALAVAKEAKDYALYHRLAREQYAKENPGRDMNVDLILDKVAEQLRGPDAKRITEQEVMTNMRSAAATLGALEGRTPMTNMMEIWFAKQAGMDISEMGKTTEGMNEVKIFLLSYISAQKGLWRQLTGMTWEAAIEAGRVPPPPPEPERLGSPGGRLREQERLDAKTRPPGVPTGPRPPTPEEEEAIRQQIRQMKGIK